MADVLNRRDFLAFGGAAVAGITLGEAGRRWMARVDERVNVAQPLAAETWAVSVCRECAASCGIRARLVDGTPVKLEGNPSCPLSRGRLCAKGQAAIESYFDPDRLVAPARRSGRRGEPRWTRISWDEAFSTLAARLDGARSAGATILALSAAGRGPVDDAWSAFWTTLGARTGSTAARTADRLAPRLAALTGVTSAPVFDLEHATYVLSFGAPIVEDWLSPVWAQRSYGRFRRSGARGRGRLVQIDERRSTTARKADEWLPVPADRQAALAYGLASVLLRENRVDRARLAAIAASVEGFESDIVARFTPDAVATATGVPVVTLLRLARDLTATAQPLVVVNADARPDLVDAVFALNALVGSLDRPGGVLAANSPAAAHVADAADVLAEAGAAPSGAAVAVLRDASVLRALDAANGRAALDRCSFVVSLSPYLDEAADAADLLMPSHTSLESWHGVVPPSPDGTELFACARPAARPRLDTRDTIAMLHGTASRMRGDAAAAARFENGEQAIAAEIARRAALRRGSVYADAFETNWTLQLERGGWWVPSAAPQSFAAAILDAGGWIDPYFAPGALTEVVKSRGGLTFVRPAGVPASAGLATPDAVAASFDRDDADRVGGAERDWPLRLVAFTPPEVNFGGGPNQPVLFELLGQPDGAPWRVWAELNPDTAARLGIAHGSGIRVASPSGDIEVIALLVERTLPDIVAVAYVPSLGGGGRWARRVDADVRRLLGRSGGAGVRVRVTRA
jgi:anaerobic selenocysteine-containing dehydrogenase